MMMIDDDDNNNYDDNNDNNNTNNDNSFIRKKQLELIIHIESSSWAGHMISAEMHFYQYLTSLTIESARSPMIEKITHQVHHQLTNMARVSSM